MNIQSSNLNASRTVGELAEMARVTADRMHAIRMAVEAGFNPDAVVRAVDGDDVTLLIGNHTGRTSAKLHSPS